MLYIHLSMKPFNATTNMTQYRQHFAGILTHCHTELAIMMAHLSTCDPVMITVYFKRWVVFVCLLKNEGLA